MSDGKRVEILLAVYNNADYLADFLDSLLAQDFDDFHILASDDASNDGSLEILESKAPLFRNGINIIRREDRSGSAKANFSFLMERSTGDYILWADADDIWKPEKVRLFVEAISELEATAGPETPLFVYSDVSVTDGSLNVLSESYWQFKKIDPQTSRSLSKTLICVPMLGCASIINRALLEKAIPVPLDLVTGHDWWTLLVAVTFGQARSIPQKTMYYRLHGSNSSIPQKVSFFSYLRAKSPAAGVSRRLMLRRLQAQALLSAFEKDLPAQQLATIRSFLDSEHHGFLKRRLFYIKNNFLYPDFPRSLALLVFG